MLKLKYFTIILLGALFITFCKKDPENPIVTPRPSPDKIDTLLPKLSDFKLFYGDLKDMQATDNLFNYDLITPLYSDYAGKARFIFFPKGSTANYNNTGVLNFPEGTLILKTFYFSKDLRNEALGRKILETRVLFLKNGIWHSGNYHWNNEQTEAFLEEEEKEVTANWIDVNGISQTTQYLIPSNLDCEKCHKSNETLEPLGPKARNLNKLFKLNISEEEMENFASELGSDCAFFIRNKAMYATEKGNVLEPITLKLKNLFIVIVKPRVHISTVEAYAGISPQKKKISLKELVRFPIEEWKNQIENDFEKTIFETHPGIRNIKTKLYKFGALYASMSGSGSAVYGLFKEEKNLRAYFRSCTVWHGRLS